MDDFGKTLQDTNNAQDAFGGMSSNSRGVESFTGEFFNCGKTNHMGKDCPKKHQPQQEQCNICWETTRPAIVGGIKSVPLLVSKR